MPTRTTTRAPRRRALHRRVGPDGPGLAGVLQELSRTVVRDLPVQAVLDRFTARAVDVLPVPSVGVTLLTPDMTARSVAASDDLGLRLERLQAEVAEGPCLLARQTGEPVLVPDLRRRTPFPAFARQALEHGARAVFALPIRFEDRTLGALDLYRSRSGNLRPRTLTTATALADVVGAFLVHADRRAALRDLAYRAFESTLHDPLTGVGNRALLAQRLAHAGRRSDRTGRAVAVLYLDLDRFKQVNDALGHRAGDELLIAVARRLGALLRPVDTLARVGGDEFVVLCEDVGDVRQVESVAARIRDSMAGPFDVRAGRVEVTVSIGIALDRPDHRPPESIIDEADSAMYEAKRQGGDRHVTLDRRPTVPAGPPAGSATDVRHALAHHQLALVYQPVVEAEGGTVTSAEALLRWTTADGVAVPAEIAVAAADETGAMTDVGRWELRQAAADRRQWQADGRPVGLSLNLSIPQLLSPELGHLIEEFLWVTASDPSLLTLELAERSLATQGARAQEVLRSLRDLGVHVALDDFGGGFVSIDALRRFPVDVVKLDRMVVSSLDGSDRSALMVGAIVGQAHALSMRVVAKGVETAAQYRQAFDIGCEECQGFFVSQPLPAGNLAAFARSRPFGDGQQTSAG